MKRLFFLLFLSLVSTALCVGGGQDERSTAGDETGESAPAGEWAAEREELVQSAVIDEGIEDPETVEAMRAVPRHEFVPEDLRGRAYRNTPLPIGHGQTISQPYIVAYMTEALELEPDDTVLEVGAGSGYQAAVLAEIVDQVYTIEIIHPLAESARARLQRLGYENVTVTAGDGYFGWPEEAPFDAIIVTAAPGHVPTPLVEQLEPGGRMIIPVGPVFSVQTLILLQKDEDGSVRTKQLLPVRFVPMTGRAQE
ncbi:MAG: protein-L-isoaspartate(D-aspartate) O-methyltransferase [Alkalispirochaetaceae bacterium]